MGLFFKKKPKEYIIKCQRCGREFTSEYNVTFGQCPDCTHIIREKQFLAKGYIKYGQMVHGVQYSENNLDYMIIHRNKIMEKYREKLGITHAEILPYSRYYEFSEEQITDMLHRAARSIVYETDGALYKQNKFFLLTSFDGVVVDMESVFAIGIATSKKFSSSYDKTFICAFFTNDPYIPVFSMFFSCGKGMFGNKKDKEVLFNELTAMCPNLKYPVTDIKQLKHLITSERIVRGGLDWNFMIGKINDAMEERGLFDLSLLDDRLGATIAHGLINDYGYLWIDVFNEVLHMDWRAEKKFWDAQIKRVFGQ